MVMETSAPSVQTLMAQLFACMGLPSLPFSSRIVPLEGAGVHSLNKVVSGEQEAG